jgi:hypothetical protein
MDSQCLQAWPAYNFKCPPPGKSQKGLRTNPRQFAQLVVIQGGAKTTAAEHVMHDTHGTGVGVGVGIVPVGWLACRSSCVVSCCKNSTVKQNNIFNGKIKKKEKRQNLFNLNPIFLFRIPPE